MTFRATSYVDSVYAGTVNANFYGPVGGSAPTFRRLTVEEGDFSGEMHLSTFVNSSGYGVFVNSGDLDANIVLEQNLPSSVDIDVSGDLAGQVIINASNSTYTWAGNVIVGNTALSTTPAYSQTSAAIGGGAVGRVPYNLHLVDCSPAHNPGGTCGYSFETRVWPDTTERETIILRHYGPVFNSSGSKPIKIEAESYAFCMPSPCPGEIATWTDQTSDFDVHVPGDWSREVWIAHELDGNGDPVGIDVSYKYRVSLVLDGSSVPLLRCGKTTAATAPGVAAYPPYEINPICPSSP